MKAEKIREAAFGDRDIDSGIRAIFELLITQLDAAGQGIAAVYAQTAFEAFDSQAASSSEPPPEADPIH